VGSRKESKMKEEEGKRERGRENEIGIFQERSGEVGKLSDRLFWFPHLPKVWVSNVR